MCFIACRYRHNGFLNILFHLPVAGHPVIGAVDAGQYGLAQCIDRKDGVFKRFYGTGFAAGLLTVLTGVEFKRAGGLLLPGPAIALGNGCGGHI